VTRRRTVVLVAACAIVALVVRYTWLFDADRYLEKKEAEHLDAVFGGRFEPPSDSDLAERARWHRGQPPCFAYAPSRLSPEDASAIVDELEQGGLVPLPNGALDHVAVWIADDERERHGDPSDDERAASVRALVGGTISGRVLFALNRGKLLAAARAADARKMDDLRARLAPLRLASPSRERLQTLWQRHRLALTISALGQIQREADRRAAAGPGSAPPQGVERLEAGSARIRYRCDQVKRWSFCDDYLESAVMAMFDEHQMRIPCDAGQGAWANAPCPTERRVGSCSNDWEVRRYYDTGGAPYAITSARGECEQTRGGVWSAL
jgi:hypothetical protein